MQAEIEAIAEAEIASGRECGLQIVAFYQGQKVIDCCAGHAAPGVPVTPDTTFMAYSVTKGVSSVIIARAIESQKGRVSYTDPISEHWPAFAVNGKAAITIADGLSHRAGLRARSLCPLKVFWLMLRGRFRDCMELGIDWIAECSPSWSYTSPWARYHPTSWSYIAGGIFAGVATTQNLGCATTELGQAGGLSHIREGAAELARTINVDAAHLALGEISNGAALPARMVAPSMTALLADAWSRSGKILLPQRGSLAWCVALVARPLLTLLLGTLALFEALVWVMVGNHSWFVRLCLPSSNGCFTAHALGSVYGALANGGQLGTASGGTVVLGSKVTAELRRCAMDPSLDVPGWPAGGRQTCGFSPWLGRQVEDHIAGIQGATGSGRRTARLPILGHTGMGGCCAYADLHSGLAIAVLKNVFSPELLNGGGPGRLCRLVDECLRRQLGLGNKDLK